MENHEFLQLECRRFAKCKRLIQVSTFEYERRKEKFGQDYKPWCGPCAYEEDTKYRTYHSE